MFELCYSIIWLVSSAPHDDEEDWLMVTLIYQPIVQRRETSITMRCSSFYIQGICVLGSTACGDTLAQDYRLFYFTIISTYATRMNMQITVLMP